MKRTFQDVYEPIGTYRKHAAVTLRRERLYRKHILLPQNSCKVFSKMSCCG
ncbi:MAG: hypothetical protein M3Z09_11190 [Acidobacteriota bacterium]|nr:hypothetical protein [Acidobacteriota bacterium]